MKTNLLHFRRALAALAFLLLLNCATTAYAFPPTYTLGTAALTVGPAAGTNSVVLALVSGNPGWTATTNATWLHLSGANQSGSSDTNVIFSFDANTGATRSGILTIGGQTLTVTQAGSTYVAATQLATLSYNLNSYYTGVAVDGAGNVYIADDQNSVVDKWTPANNTLTPLISVLPGYAHGVALDASGNVYIADNGSNLIDKWTVANSNLAILVKSGVTSPQAVAVDSASNVYIADQFNSAIQKWSAATSNLTTLLTNSQVTDPFGVAVDAAGNVYVADTDNDAVEKWTAATSNFTTLIGSGLTFPYDVAVDGSGNVYITDTGDGDVKVWSAASQTVTTLVTNLPYAEGMAVDGKGNAYFTDISLNVVDEQTSAFVDPTAKSEPASGGTDTLPMVLPSTENLSGPFVPTSDSGWLTINGATNGVVSFSLTPNTTGSPQTGHISLLGQSITVTQASGPAFTGIPAGSNYGCNPAVVPTAANIQSLVTASDSCSAAPVTVTEAFSTNSCAITQTFTITAIDTCANSATNYLTNTWTVAMLSFSSVPANTNLGCNPGSLPTDTTISNAVAFSDTCSVVTNTVSHQDSTNGCTWTRVFTINAGDTCGDTATAHVTNTWTVATLAFNNVPANTNLGCNPVTLPTDASISNAVSFIDPCSTVTNIVTHQDNTSNCTVTRVFTINAGDLCGDTATAHVTNTWTAATLAFNSVPASTNLGCNPGSLPTDTTISNAVSFIDPCSTVTNIVTHQDSTNGCTVTRVFTINAGDLCGDSATARVTNTWTVATLAFSSVPANTNLGCNPVTLPTDASISNAVTVADSCSSVTNTVSHLDGTNGCVITRVFTISSADGCGDAATVYVTNTWTADTTPLVLTGVPVGTNLGVNPTNIPTASSVQAEVSSTNDTCSAATVHVTATNSANGSVLTQVLTITATNDCGNSATAFVTNTWTAALFTNVVMALPTNGGTVGGGGVFASNSLVTVTATPSNGYTFSNWTINGAQASVSNSYTFTITSNVTLVANFAQTPPHFELFVGSTNIVNGQTNAVDFGSVPLEGTGAVLTFTVSNTGGTTLTLSNISLPDGYEFDAIPAPIAPFGSATFMLHMDPAPLGIRSGSVSITNNDPSDNPFTFPVTGFVNAKILSLTGNLDFGVVPVGSSESNIITLSNAGNLTLTVSNITYPNGFTGAFSNTIAPGASTNVTVTFSPTLPTNYSGTATVYSDGSGSSTLPIMAFGANTNLLLTIITNGDGKVTPNDAKVFKPGTKVTLTAVPGTTNVFAGWSGSTNSTNNPLVFFMEDSTIVQANFIANPFLRFVGTYNGLFTATDGEVTETNAGMLKGLVLTPKGTYSASLLLNGASKSFTGGFNLALQSSKPVALGGAEGTVQLSLTLVSNNSATQVVGTVSNANWVSTNLTADRATNTPLASAYTMLIPADTNTASAPIGSGYALISSTSGTAKTPATAKISGVLADGTTFSQSASVSLDGDVPVYASLYSGKGLLLGWINLTNASGDTLSWVHPTNKTGLFRIAFASTNEIALSPWTNPPAGAALPASVVVVAENTNSITTSSEFTLTITNKNLTFGGETGSTPLSGSIAPKTGLVKVTVGSGAAKTTGYGVILLNGTNGGGYFLTKTNSGAIILQP